MRLLCMSPAWPLWSVRTVVTADALGNIVMAVITLHYPHPYSMNAWPRPCYCGWRIQCQTYKYVRVDVWLLTYTNCTFISTHRCVVISIRPLHVCKRTYGSTHRCVDVCSRHIRAQEVRARDRVVLLVNSYWMSRCKLFILLFFIIHII
jgi:hypothetical protein